MSFLFSDLRSTGRHDAAKEIASDGGERRKGRGLAANDILFQAK